MTAEALHLSSLAAAQSGDLREAARLLTAALSRSPENARWRRDLGMIHYAANRWPEAAESFRRALKAGIGGSKRELFKRLGHCLVRMERYAEAADAFRNELAEDPNAPGCHYMLASLYSRLGFHHLSRSHWERLTELLPDDSQARAGLAYALWCTGDVQACLDICRTEIANGRESTTLGSFYLTSLLHAPGQTAAELRGEHEDWGRRHCRPELRFDSYGNPPDPERPLRIGYISGEFFEGPAAHFLMPILRNHDRALFEIYCYHSNPVSDGVTEGFRQVCGGWRDVYAMDDAQLSAMIRDDGIDILMDLSGHFPYNRLRAVDLHPAPVTGMLPNYPATSGVPGVDFIIADDSTCPDGCESQYTERAHRLSTWYLPYQPPDGAPELSPPPRLRNGTITFGLFQRPPKLNSEVWDAIAEVLGKVENSRLLVHFLAQERMAGELERRGIDESRVCFRGARRVADHLAVVADADIALDTFPYNGQTTTMECLWMGVPVVTVAGSTHVARVGLSILKTAQLSRWCAASPAEYVDIACRLAGDHMQLDEMRRKLRQIVSTSPLTDAAGITRQIEAIYRQEWRGWCARRPPGPWSAGRGESSIGSGGAERKNS